jgi:tetratricopeptide (TPR) repeat protein
VKGYSTREVADVLGLSPSRILGWVRSGLIEPRRGPGGAYVYSFPDIVLLRTARELLDADVPTRRVRQALEALREQLPVGRPLSAVRVSSSAGRVLVRDADSVWEPDSGQLLLDFPVSEVAARVEPIARKAVESASGDGSMDADDWYDLALDLEAVAADRAAEAYRRAIALDEGHAEALLNLGRLLHEDGRLDEALGRYRAAAAADAANAAALYNAGVVLEDLGRPDAAREAYEAALAVDDAMATAHFNLSRLLEREGRQAEALGHLAAYRRLVRETGS